MKLFEVKLVNKDYPIATVNGSFENVEALANHFFGASIEPLNVIQNTNSKTIVVIRMDCPFHLEALEIKQ